MQDINDGSSSSSPAIPINNGAVANKYKQQMPIDDEPDLMPIDEDDDNNKEYNGIGISVGVSDDMLMPSPAHAVRAPVVIMTPPHMTGGLIASSSAAVVMRSHSNHNYDYNNNHVPEGTVSIPLNDDNNVGMDRDRKTVALDNNMNASAEGAISLPGMPSINDDGDDGDVVKLDHKVATTIVSSSSPPPPPPPPPQQRPIMAESKVSSPMNRSSASVAPAPLTNNDNNNSNNSSTLSSPASSRPISGATVTSSSSSRARQAFVEAPPITNGHVVSDLPTPPKPAVTTTKATTAAATTASSTPVSSAITRPSPPQICVTLAESQAHQAALTIDLTGEEPLKRKTWYDSYYPSHTDRNRHHSE
jgi:hypothetical protein